MTVAVPGAPLITTVNHSRLGRWMRNAVATDAHLSSRGLGCLSAAGDPCLTDAVTAVPDASSPRAGHRRPSRATTVSFGVTAAMLAVLAVIAMGDAVLECSSVVRGRPNDGTSGAVWLNWTWEQTGGGPFRSVQYVTGGNLGDVLWRPLLIVNVAILVPMWALSKLVGPVCSYNISFVLGYIASGLGMWALARHLVRSRAAATVAAVLFAFTAFSQLKAEWGHAAGVYLMLFPLLVLAIVRLWERVTTSRILVAGLCWGCLPYVDGYFLSFAALVVLGLAAGMSVSTFHRHGRGAGRWLLGRLGATALAGGVALVVLVPWVFALLSDYGAINDQVTRGADDAGRYSARLWEYVLPSPRHPLAPDWYETWRIEHMHRSNLAETALYLGVVPMVLAGLGVLSVRRARATSDQPDAATDDSVQFGRSTVTAGLGGLVMVGVLFSLNPDAELLGVPLPMPSEAIRAVLPQVRVFSRLVILVSTGLIALAAIGLESVLVREVLRPRRLAMAGGVAVIALFESLTFAPWSPPTWSYERTPAVFAALAADDTVDTVALYPMLRAGENGDVLVTYQPELGKVLVNPASDTGAVDDPADVVRGLAALSDPQSLPALRMLGTDVIVLTEGGTEVTTSGPPPEGLELASTTTCAPRVLGVPARDPDGRDCLASRVYRILPGPEATAVIALGAGWGDFEADGWGGRRPATDGAQVAVVSRTSGDDAIVRFELIARDGGGAVEVIDDAGEVVERVDVGTTSTPVSFTASVGRTWELRLTGVAEVWASGFDVGD